MEWEHCLLFPPSGKHSWCQRKGRLTKKSHKSFFPFLSHKSFFPFLSHWQTPLSFRRQSKGSLPCFRYLSADSLCSFNLRAVQTRSPLHMAHPKNLRSSKLAFSAFKWGGGISFSPNYSRNCLKIDISVLGSATECHPRPSQILMRGAQPNPQLCKLVLGTGWGKKPY